VRVDGGVYEEPARAAVVDVEASVDHPPRRRTRWSLKSIVEDVAGRPIDELQDPNRPGHPYMESKTAPNPVDPRPPWASPPRREPPEKVVYDPVGHVYPPLIGSIGRTYHGSEHEHHQETLERHPPERQATPGDPPRLPGPSHRPERIYLHYLLLHLDRLNPSALQYLRHAVDEELAHRARPPLPPTE
jgi:hypothetical protein